MEYLLLGPLEVRSGGRVVTIGPPQERALLLRLLLDAGRVVSVDTLLEDLWEGAPPASADVSLRVRLSRLRKALALAGAAEALVTRHPGYVIELGAGDDIDARRFERLVTEARTRLAGGEPAMAAATFTEALALWRGRALADVADHGFARAEAARLDEARLVAVEDRIDADLACGRHGALVGELEALCTQHPLRERLWCQRVLALYRCGRQADALRAYQDVRAILVEELGVEPSPPLTRLEQAVLTQSPDLDWVPAVRERSLSGPGVVTLLFTDIEGSTQLWEKHPEGMPRALEHHDELIAGAVKRHGGRVFKHTGDGICAVFPIATPAVAAAIGIQRSVAEHDWGEIGALRVRIALHSGEAQPRDDDFAGPALNRCARLLAAAHGGQTVASAAVVELAEHPLPSGATLTDLGQHRLRDLTRPERVFQFSDPRCPERFPALRTMDARPHNLPVEITPFVGRERGVGDSALDL